MATKFRYLKWHITKKRATGTNAVQAAEFQLLDASGNSYAWPSGTSVTATPAGVSTAEGADKLIDGATSTKLCVASGWTSTSSQTGNLEIVFDVGSGNEINLSKYNRYCYYTANDEDRRDPISWTLYGSNDASAWKVLDIQSDVSGIPTTRYTQAGVWEMDVESENYIFQPGIVGKTNIVEGAVIPFPRKLYLYKEGNECEKITGGWSMVTTSTTPGSITKNADHVFFTGTRSGITPEKPIDFTGFTTLCIEWEIVSVSSGNARFALANSKNYEDYYDHDAHRIEYTSPTTRAVAAFGVSDVSELKYVQVSGYCANVRVYNIWLE